VCSLIILHEAATRAPAATSILGRLRRPPLPSPAELYTWATAGRIVAYELDVWVLVKVGVGMELSDHQVLHLFRARRINVRQAGDLGVDRGGRYRRAVRGGIADWTLLSHYECKGEVQFVAIAEANEEGWLKAVRDALWILRID